MHLQQYFLQKTLSRIPVMKKNCQCLGFWNQIKCLIWYSLMSHTRRQKDYILCKTAAFQNGNFKNSYLRRIFFGGHLIGTKFAAFDSANIQLFNQSYNLTCAFLKNLRPLILEYFLMYDLQQGFDQSFMIANLKN